MHRRASQWYEDNGFELEAFHHAAAANDIDRAERLIDGKGMPLHFRGAIDPVIHWLETLPKEVLDARPSLWVTYASATMLSGDPLAVEQKLLAAEAGMRSMQPDDKSRDLEGQIAGYTGSGGFISERFGYNHGPVEARPGIAEPR